MTSDAANIEIAGNDWTIKHGPCRDYGVCYHEARRIVIGRNLTAAEDIGVIVHELLHAAFPDLSEDAIERGELAVMNGLRWGGHIPSEEE